MFRPGCETGRCGERGIGIADSTLLCCVHLANRCTLLVRGRHVIHRAQILHLAVVDTRGFVITAPKQFIKPPTLIIHRHSPSRRTHGF
jgi:hypothetical protein